MTTVGRAVGTTVGGRVGGNDAMIVGGKVGNRLGAWVGLLEGLSAVKFAADGSMVGSKVAFVIGSIVGMIVGAREGAWLEYLVCVGKLEETRTVVTMEGVPEGDLVEDLIGDMVGDTGGNTSLMVGKLVDGDTASLMIGSSNGSESFPDRKRTMKMIIINNITTPPTSFLPHRFFVSSLFDSTVVATTVTRERLLPQGSILLFLEPSDFQSIHQFGLEHVRVDQ